VLRANSDSAEQLASAIVDVKARIGFCSVCFNIAEGSLCVICESPRRDRSQICVVETPLDLLAIERTAEYQGLYHVLGGVISPIDGIGPEDIHIPELANRVRDGGVEEVIVATNADIEGEATAVYVHRVLEPLGIPVTRPARGLPVGGDLEYADELTLARAISGRRGF
jgi:recombination protein RecR